MGKGLIFRTPVAEAILFDFGQTLVDSADGFRSAEKEVQIKIYHALGLTLWEEFLFNYRRVRTEFHENCNFSRKAFWREIYLYYRREPDLQLLEKWEHDYWDKVKAETIPFPETEQVLENLVSKYQMALITNAERQEPHRKHRISQFPGLKKFLKVIIIAGESGVPPKPDRIPFLLCLRKLGIAPAEAIYVGDDWRIDICGASDAGIQPIWLQHRLVQRTWPAVKTPVPVITSLECLLDLERVLS